MLLAKGYPDIGWNPCGGERYLDFLRFAVFVNGEAGGGGGAGGWAHWPEAPSGVAHILSHRPGLGGAGSRGRQPGMNPWGAGSRAVREGTLGGGSRGLLTSPELLGESVEENANVVVRLLIRKPECFGPALRGEGGSGLLAAIEEAIRISEDPARDGPGVRRDRRREQ